MDNQPPAQNQKTVNHKPPLILIIIALIFVGVLALMLSFSLLRQPQFLPPGSTKVTPSANPQVVSAFSGLKKFNSDDEFKAYLQRTREGRSYSSVGMSDVTMIQTPKTDGSVQQNLPRTAGGGEEAYRVSETNVQVASIDEPDIVKTDGKRLYFSSDMLYYNRLLPMRQNLDSDSKIGVIPPRPYDSIQTRILQAFPPEKLSQIGKIDKYGNMLLEDNILAIFASDGIVSFDVSDSTKPKEVWNYSYKNNASLTTARLYKGKIYLVVSSPVDYRHPCPIQPLSNTQTSPSIECRDVYYPGVDTTVNTIYTAYVLDAANGIVEDKLSFVGSSSMTVVYMSKNALYVSFALVSDLVSFFYDFFESSGRDLLPSSALERLRKLKDYELSNAAKMAELQSIFSEYQRSLSDDDRLKSENEMNNRMKTYLNKRKRDLEKTGIVKIALDGFKIQATGVVSGRPLNQFSLDEYNDYLRIATTTTGQIGWVWGFGGMSESASDVYILDGKLTVVGSVTDLGLTEKIYSVRFVEDKAYVVTFKQIDPFYILDVSDPKHPKLSGELKIPGFSSYLHPISKDIILGIGREGSKMKLSLFDVSTPDKPEEMDKYLLQEYSSEVLQNQHAFLLDKKHKIFFLPTERGGLVFSYKDNKLSMVKAVSSAQVKRSIYLNDYLYIIGLEKISVLDENSWDQVKELVLQDSSLPPPPYIE